jgi:hypothetical protein
VAGPVFNILLRDPLTATQIRELDAWLRTFTGDLETRSNAAGERDEWYFRVDDASALGLLDRFRACMIGLALIEPRREMDGDEEEQMMLRLGFWPRHGMNVYAMCKDFPTGRVASYLILRLLERYDGYLDLCMRERVPRRSPLDANDRVSEQNIPGKRYIIRYWAPDPQYAFYFSCWWQKDVIDIERLRWWLQDENSVLPGFRME